MAEIPTADWTRLNAAADRFEYAWKQGPRPRIEEYVAEVEPRLRAAWLEELLRVELELRRREGEGPTPEEYLGRFPDHRATIEVVFGGGISAHESDSVANGCPPGPRPSSVESHPLASILAALSRTIGPVPRVLLRDTGADVETVPIRPASPEMPRGAGRYKLLGEIGHGGMGAVLKARDPDLGRDLALKVLLDEHRDDPELVRRFIEEAQIGGQLQHRGIVPVHELGQLEDGRPYFTMKLVMGRTLSALLADREDPGHERPRFLGIFEQVCQTIAYAHARGVIHRDLKPSNIMVGSFGEVQVMDWGLAKVLPPPGVDESGEPAEEMTLVDNPRLANGLDAGTSRPGSVMGTPAYMSPEQARGDVGRVSQRSDVFGLGSILCEILTGRAAYTGPSRQVILGQAMRGETADALRRLDGSEADVELVSLARRCLEVDPDDRPRDAGDVARRLAAYVAGVQERLRAAERARAAEEARAEEAKATATAAERARAAAEGRASAERRARRMTVGLAASVLIAGALGAAGWTWVERDRMARIAARTSQISAAMQEASGLWGQAQSARVGDLITWTRAKAAAQRARDLLEPGLDAALRSQVESLLAAVDAERATAESAARSAEADRNILDQLIDIRSARSDDPSGTMTDRAYSAVFREAGIDVSALPPAEAGARIKARPSAVAAAWIAALDDWAAVRRSLRHDRSGALRLSEAANSADDDTWRAGLRSALDLADRPSRTKALRDLAASTSRETAPAVNLNLLGTALASVGEPKVAEEVLRAARRRFPDDVWLNHDLGHLLEAQSRGDEALRYYSIARALRPETAHDLAHLLESRGDSVEAVAVFRDLVRLRPDSGRDWRCYGHLLKERGDRPGSMAALTRAAAILRPMIANRPDDPEAHAMLGMIFQDQGKLDEAIAEIRVALRVRPNNADNHHRIGMILADQGKRAEAVAECREAIRLGPGSAYPHNTLAIALIDQGHPSEAIAECREAIRLRPDFAYAHNTLGLALQARGQADEAIAAYREALRLRPDYLNPRLNLTSALRARGDLERACTEAREAVHGEPTSGMAHAALGIVLHELGRDEEAIAESREAARLGPDFPETHNALGLLLLTIKHDYRAAEAEFHAAIRVKPDDATAHMNLGHALRGQGKPVRAVAEYREAIRLGPDLVDPHIGLGAILCDIQHDYRAAEAEFRAAVRLKPDHATAHTNLGNALIRLGNPAEAIAEYRKAIELDPADVSAHNNLGTALQALGKGDEAIAEFREAIRLHREAARPRATEKPR